jgi:hypothetical protein
MSLHGKIWFTVAITFTFLGCCFFFLLLLFYLYFGAEQPPTQQQLCNNFVCVCIVTIRLRDPVSFPFSIIGLISYHLIVQFFLCISFLSRLDKSVMSMPLCHTTNFNFYFVLFFYFVSEMFLPLAGRRENQSSAVNR